MWEKRTKNAGTGLMRVRVLFTMGEAQTKARVVRTALRNELELGKTNKPGTRNIQGETPNIQGETPTNADEPITSTGKHTL